VRRRAFGRLATPAANSKRKRNVGPDQDAVFVARHPIVPLVLACLYLLLLPLPLPLQTLHMLMRYLFLPQPVPMRVVIVVVMCGSFAILVVLEHAVYARYCNHDS
jgi:hypothetical protein